MPVLEWSVIPMHGLILVGLLTIWLHLPFTFIILYAARLGIPRELYEAARVDGASPVQAFRTITLPLLAPAMLIALLFRYIFAFRLFSEVWLMTQGGPCTINGGGRCISLPRSLPLQFLRDRSGYGLDHGRGLTPSRGGVCLVTRRQMVSDAR